MMMHLPSLVGFNQEVTAHHFTILVPLFNVLISHSPIPQHNTTQIGTVNQPSCWAGGGC